MITLKQALKMTPEDFKKIRKERGLTAYRVGKDTGLAYRSLYSLESGKAWYLRTRIRLICYYGLVDMPYEEAVQYI